MRPRKSASSSANNKPELQALLGFIVGASHRNVLLLHLAEQTLHPALELSLQLGAVNNQHHRRVAEAVFVFEDQPGGGQQGEGLARTLRMPHQAARLLRVGATRQDRSEERRVG